MNKVIPEEADTNTASKNQLDTDDSDQNTNETSSTEKPNDTTSSDTSFTDQRIGNTTVVDQDTSSVDQQVNKTPTVDQKVDDTITKHQNMKDPSTADQKATQTIIFANDVEPSPEEMARLLVLVRSLLIPRSNLTFITNSSPATTVVKWHNADCSLHEFNLNFSKPEDQGKFGKYLSVCIALSKLRHPNIQQILGYVSQEEEMTKPSPSIVTELLDLTLTKFLTDHKRNEIQTTTHINICYDVARAVSYLHSSKVLHLLIRSDCVLVTRDHHAKLCDITASLLYQCGLNPEAKMVNANYLPPDDEMPPSTSGSKIDIFSTGVLFLQTITHTAPNPVAIDETARTEIERRQDHIDMVHSSHPLLTLIISCISNKPDDRPTDEEMCTFLEASLSAQD